MKRPSPVRACAPRPPADRFPPARRRARPPALLARFAALSLLILVASCGRREREPTHLAAPAAETTKAKPADSRALLRVCADPNNLPFSNERREGFENALADLVAADLGAEVEYTWWPQRRGFVRSTLGAGLCDVVIGVPEDLEIVLTTRPYYRSTYVFVTRKARALHLASLEDGRLRQLAIGVHVVGDDYASVPPASALAARGIVRNVRGYSVYGSYDRPNPPADLVTAVANGEVDVAIAWGPLAGFFAARGHLPPGRDGKKPALEVTPIEPLEGVRLQFAISIGVRRNDAALRDRLNTVLERRAADVDAILDRFSVPRVPTASR